MIRAYRQTPAKIQQALDNALNPDAELKQPGVPADAEAVGIALHDMAENTEHEFQRQQEQIDDKQPKGDYVSRSDADSALAEVLRQAKATIPNGATVNEDNELIMQRTEGDAVSELFRVELPQGGGETGGGGFGLGVADNYDIELITEVYNIDKENMPTRIDITQKDDGTPFAYDGIILWTDVKDTYSYSMVLFNNTNFMQSHITHGDKTRMNLFITDGTTMFYYYNNQPIPAFVMKQSYEDVNKAFYPNAHIKDLPEKFTAVSLGAVSAITSITFYKVWGLKKK